MPDKVKSVDLINDGTTYEVPTGGWEKNAYDLMQVRLQEHLDARPHGEKLYALTPQLSTVLLRQAETIFYHYNPRVEVVDVHVRFKPEHDRIIAYTRIKCVGAEFLWHYDLRP
jgi:hypothetical protein